MASKKIATYKMVEEGGGLVERILISGKDRCLRKIDVTGGLSDFYNTTYTVSNTDDYQLVNYDDVDILEMYDIALDVTNYTNGSYYGSKGISIGEFQITYPNSLKQFTFFPRDFTNASAVTVRVCDGAKLKAVSSATTITTAATASGTFSGSAQAVFGGLLSNGGEITCTGPLAYPNTITIQRIYDDLEPFPSGGTIFPSGGTIVKPTGTTNVTLSIELWSGSLSLYSVSVLTAYSQSGTTASIAASAYQSMLTFPTANNVAKNACFANRMITVPKNAYVRVYIEDPQGKVASNVLATRYSWKEGNTRTFGPLSGNTTVKFTMNNTIFVG